MNFLIPKIILPVYMTFYTYVHSIRLHLFFFFFEINNQSVAFGEISVDEKDQQRKHIKSMYDLHSINMTNSHHHHVLHFREYSPTLETMTDWKNFKFSISPTFKKPNRLPAQGKRCKGCCVLMTTCSLHYLSKQE